MLLSRLEEDKAALIARPELAAQFELKRQVERLLRQPGFPETARGDFHIQTLHGRTVMLLWPAAVVGDEVASGVLSDLEVLAVELPRQPTRPTGSAHCNRASGCLFLRWSLLDESGRFQLHADQVLLRWLNFLQQQISAGQSL